MVKKYIQKVKDCRKTIFFYYVLCVKMYLKVIMMFMDIMNEINNDSDILKRLVILSEYIGSEKYYKTVFSKLSQLRKKTYFDTVSYNSMSLGDSAILSNKERERSLIYSEETPRTRIEEQFLAIRRLVDFIETPTLATSQLSMNLICKMHEILFEKTNKKVAGRFKTVDLDVVTVNRRGKVINTRKTVAPQFVDLYLSKLINEFCTSSGHTVLKAIVFIADFLTIHPFNEGSTVIANVFFRYFLLKDNIDLLQYFSFEKYLNVHHDKYIRVLEEKNAGFQHKKYSVAMIKPFILFMMNLLIDGYKTLEDDIEKLNNTKYNKRDDVIDVIKSIEGEFTINSILENLEIIINKQTVNRIIKELLDENILNKIGDRKNTKYIVNN